MNFCSRSAQATDPVMAGTGVRGEAYVFLPVPKQVWGENELNAHWASSAELEAIIRARRARVIVRLYAPPRDAIDPPILVHPRPDGGRPPALDDLLAAFAGRWSVDESGAPRLAICTHGTRDRCCAKWGFAAYLTARRLFEAGAAPFEPLECSHLGGDRFAATGIVFPSGSMYGRLDLADLAALTGLEAQGRIEPALYRGRVFEDALVQVVRAGLARDGHGADAAAPLTVEGEPQDGLLTATLEGRRFAVRVSSDQTSFYSSCAAMEEGRASRARRTVYQGAERLSD